jgi:ABC-type antimicrobial peptide transport system permease subunit
LRGAMMWESVLVGFAASVLGIISGMMLAIVLTAVVNPAFFRWTVHLAIPWNVLAFTPVWIVIAAIVAALLPADRAARLNLSEALRAE